VHQREPLRLETRQAPKRRTGGRGVGVTVHELVVRDGRVGDVAATTNARAASTDVSEAVILAADHVVLAVGSAIEDIEAGPLIVGGRLPVPLATAVGRLEAIEIGGAVATRHPPPCE
jgi:hypothetical protein